ncbi:helix-turn-helix domain-containing protein, partial [Streptomyces sp. SID10815]|uniref:MarR family transcriptional regulator n=1 Tax=Streptomyces sp. SID10815 TaxID=2706027 RepID=UPI0013C7D373
MPRTATPLLTSPVPRLADPDRRRTSASAVLRSVLAHGPVARSTIARLTGLSPAAVSDHCARLARLGLIREAAAPRQSGGVGRPHV